MSSKQKSYPEVGRTGGFGSLVPLLTALFFFAVLFLFFPYRVIFQSDSDEGINLIKAALVEDGYPLFSQVWSDQPPVFTLMLAEVLKLADNDLLAGRTLVLLFAGLMVCCLAYFVQKTWDPLHALTVVFLLLLLPFLPALSVSVMVGLPAISLAFLSLAVMAVWHENHKLTWLIVSGAALGISIMTKLFTAILAPIFILGIFLDVIGHSVQTGADNLNWPAAVHDLLEAARKHWRKAARQALLWLVVFGVVSVGIALVAVKPEHMLDLILPHLASENVEYFDAYAEEYPIWRVFMGTPVFFLLAGMGVVRALHTQRWLALYPFAWSVTAFTLLSFHSPVWYHHTLLVTLPACALAAGAAGDLLALPLNYLRRHEHTPASLARWVLLVAVLCGLLWQRLAPTMREFDDQPYFISLQHSQPPREEKILEEIKLYKPYTNWMFTDMPMFAFRSNIPVPPELAVITSKRLASEELTGQDIASLVQRYKPEIILLGRYEFSALDPVLAARYREEDSRLGIRLYVRKDLPDF